MRWSKIKYGLLALNVIAIGYYILAKSNADNSWLLAIMTLVFTLLTIYLYFKLWNIFDKYSSLLIRLSVTMFFAFAISFISLAISSLVFALLMPTKINFYNSLFVSFYAGAVTTIFNAAKWGTIGIFNFVALHLIFYYKNNSKRKKSI